MSAEPTAAGGHSQSPAAEAVPVLATKDQRLPAAFAYLFTAMSGILVLLFSRPHQRFARWHAIQAILLGFTAFLLGMALNALSAFLALGGQRNLFNESSTLSAGMLAWLAAYLLVIVTAVAAVQGRSVRIPGFAGIADRYA